MKRPVAYDRRLDELLLRLETDAHFAINCALLTSLIPNLVWTSCPHSSRWISWCPTSFSFLWMFHTPPHTLSSSVLFPWFQFRGTPGVKESAWTWVVTTGSVFIQSVRIEDQMQSHQLVSDMCVIQFHEGYAYRLKSVPKLDSPYLVLQDQQEWYRRKSVIGYNSESTAVSALPVHTQVQESVLERFNSHIKGIDIPTQLIYDTLFIRVPDSFRSSFQTQSPRIQPVIKAIPSTPSSSKPALLLLPLPQVASSSPGLTPRHSPLLSPCSACHGDSFVSDFSTVMASPAKSSIISTEGEFVNPPTPPNRREYQTPS